jgi:flagellar biosynthetic protein FlhB
MDESSEKPEQATPQKLRDAQRKGVSLRSMELSMLVTLLVAGALLLFMVPQVAQRVAANTHGWILAAGVQHGQVSLPMVVELSEPGINLLIVQFVLVAGLAALAAAAYGGIHFSGHPLKPDFSKLNPAKGFKRIFSMHTLAETAKATLKIAALLVITAGLSAVLLSHLAAAQVPNLPRAGVLLLDLTLKVLGWLIVMQLLFAAYDLWYAQRRYMSQLRMTRHEVMEEHKRQEGDPEIRRKRKQIQSGLMAQIRALGNVKNADVVITNPTHVAVALQYLPQRMDAPMVVCTGRGTVAAMMRALARRHRVPQVRQPALARALIAEHRIGETIAREHQQPVVFIYRWLLAQPGLRKPAGVVPS